MPRGEYRRATLREYATRGPPNIVTSAPARFVEYLRQNGYHPRSSAHGKALCDLVLRDLLDHCPQICEHAENGKLVFDYDTFVRRICDRYAQRWA